MKYITLTISLIVLYFLCSCNKFGAGSYPYAKEYQCNTSAKYLVDDIITIKINHPELKVLTPNEADSLYNIDNRAEPYFNYYFKLNINDTIAIVHCVVDTRFDNPALLLLNSVTYSKNLGNFKRINSGELSKEENDLIITAFERQVLKLSSLNYTSE